MIRENTDGMDKKRRMHCTGRAMLRRLVKAMGLVKGSYEIRSCMGGPAVGGEAILHADRFYVHLSMDGQGFSYWRTCNGRRDFVGGPNQPLPFGAFHRPEDLAALGRAILRAIGDADRRAAEVR